VYEPHEKKVFMHGGNAGPIGKMANMDDGEEDSSAEYGDGTGREKCREERRLDDFWCMTLKRYVIGTDMQ
jgi:hypothetical protein